jgi:hypothetical protein
MIGVSKPMHIPLMGFTRIPAKRSSALTAGPVNVWGSPRSWIAKVSAKRTAVRVNHLTLNIKITSDRTFDSSLSHFFSKERVE